MTTTTDHTDLQAFVASLGLDYTAEFVPASRAVKGQFGEGLNWRIVIAKGRQTLETPYHQGIGHIPGYKQQRRTLDVDAWIKSACETGKVYDLKAQQDRRYGGKPKPIPAPSILDALYCLTLDGSVIDHATFEDWASEYGYDTDSRAAEWIYRACLDIGLKLRSMLGDDNLARLRELFQDY